MFCIPDLFSISKAIVSLSCLITKYSVVRRHRWHRCIVGSNLMRHRNGEFSYRGHRIRVAWSCISLNLLNKEKLILCSIFLTFVIKALYCSCRWLASEECLANPYNGKALFLQWRSGWLMDRRKLSFLSPSRSLQGCCWPLLVEVLVWGCGVPQGSSSARSPLAPPLSRGAAEPLCWWCSDMLQMEDRGCHGTAVTFCFHTERLFWLCPVGIFVCMNFRAITLVLLFMSINWKEKKCHPYSFYTRKSFAMVLDSSAWYFFHHCLFSVKRRYFYPRLQRSGTQWKVPVMTALLADQQGWAHCPWLHSQTQSHRRSLSGAAGWFNGKLFFGGGFLFDQSTEPSQGTAG